MNVAPAVQSKCVHAHTGWVCEQGEEGRNIGVRGVGTTHAP